MGAIGIRDAEPRERKFKKPGGGKEVKREQIGGGRRHRKDRGGCDEVRVDIERHAGAFVGRVKTFPGRERGRLAIPCWGVL